MTTEQTGGVLQHRLLSHYHRILADYHESLAAYHWEKHANPIDNCTPIPVEPLAISLFRACDYKGFIKAAGLCVRQERCGGN